MRFLITRLIDLHKQVSLILYCLSCFAEFSVVSTKLNKGKPRYFINHVYKYGSIGLYLSGEWYAVYNAQPVVHNNWPSINDLIRVLNTCLFYACFVYVKLIMSISFGDRLELCKGMV